MMLKCELAESYVHLGEEQKMGNRNKSDSPNYIDSVIKTKIKMPSCRFGK